jgi:fumarate hydratase class I
VHSLVANICSRYPHRIRLPRHGASCPVGLGRFCSADRNIKCKINKDGIWIEKLDSNPSELIPEELRKAGEGDAVKD